jgi:hypothetical protein
LFDSVDAPGPAAGDTFGQAIKGASDLGYKRGLTARSAFWAAGEWRRVQEQELDFVRQTFVVVPGRC